RYPSPVKYAGVLARVVTRISSAGEALMSRVMVKLLCVAVACAIAVAGTTSAATPLRVDVLSNRADLISGGDALVAVELPAGTSPSSARMTLGGHDVTAEFAQR